MHYVRLAMGHMAFVIGVAVVSVAGTLLGDDHDLGVFAKALSEPIWGQANVVSRGLMVLRVSCIAMTVVVLAVWAIVGAPVFGDCIWLALVGLQLAATRARKRAPRETTADALRPVERPGS